MFVLGASALFKRIWVVPQEYYPVPCIWDRIFLFSFLKGDFIMKNLKKIIAVALAAVLLVAFAGCSAGKPDTYKVGIIQFLPHSSLDNCTQGVINSLKAAGIEYDVQVGSSGSPDADCKTFAENMVSGGQYNMIIAVATPAATAAYSAVATASADIPVVFCAVSDPVAAGLVKSMEAPGNNCTGTRDAFDIEGQVNLIKSLQPDIESLGVIYTTSEANSISQLKTLKEVCDKAGIEVVSQGITDASELNSASVSIVSKVDAVTNLTDNNVVDNMSVLLEQANAAGIPVYGSEIEQVKKGCAGSASLDYVKLGEQTGDIALKVKENNNNASDIPALTVTESFEVLNKGVLGRLRIAIPDSLKDVQTIDDIVD